MKHHKLVFPDSATCVLSRPYTHRNGERYEDDPPRWTITYKTGETADSTATFHTRHLVDEALRKLHKDERAYDDRRRADHLLPPFDEAVIGSAIIGDERAHLAGLVKTYNRTALARFLALLQQAKPPAAGATSKVAIDSRLPPRAKITVASTSTAETAVYEGAAHRTWQDEVAIEEMWVYIARASMQFVHPDNQARHRAHMAAKRLEWRGQHADRLIRFVEEAIKDNNAA